MVKIIKILGKPGTGKTTYLANKMLEKIDDGCSFDDILFTTYSRSASRAIYSKLYEKRGIKKKELHNFGTIYRLANKTLDLQDDNYIKLDDFLKFSDKYGIEFDVSNMTVKKIEDIEEFGPTGDNITYTEGNILFVWWQMLKCTFISNNHVREEIKKYSLLNRKQQQALSHRSIFQIIDFFDLWEEYKKEKEKYEYQDMLQQLLLEQTPYHIAFKFAFIDETHDFGNLQMNLLHMWYNNDFVKEVYICYDPLQTIYKFTGSDPNIVASIVADEDITLKKSYRVPQLPWKVATNMAESIGDKSMDGISPSDSRGDVIFIDSMNNLLLQDFVYSDESTFFLLRRNKDVGELLNILKRNRIPVVGLGRTKTIWEGIRFRSVYNLILRLEKNLPLEKEEVRNLIMILPVKGILRRGVKQDFKKRKFKFWGEVDKRMIDDKLSLFYGLFDRDVGSAYDVKELVCQPNISFNEEMKKYIRKITNKDIFATKIKRSVGTYHASKGLEADNVVLFDYYLRDDWDVVDETKLAYVGATRTQKKLFIKGFFDGNGFVEQFI